MKDTQQKIFPLVDIASGFLSKNNDGDFVFGPLGQRALQVGLDGLFASGLDPVRPICEVVGLAHAMTELGSRSAAARIIASLRADRRSRRILSVVTGRVSDEAAAFLHGRAARKSAQMVGTKAPNGTMRVSALSPIARIGPHRRRRS